MPEKAIISHRGEKYEIGRGKRFYGIWAVGAPYDAPVDRWPETRDGWGQAWMRFAAIEVPGTITAVRPERTGLRSVLNFGRSGPKADPADPAAADGAAAGAAAARRRGGTALLAGEGLLVLGVVLGLAGLFPDYAGGQSLLSQSDRGRAAPVLRDRVGGERRADRAERLAAENRPPRGAVRPRAERGHLRAVPLRPRRGDLGRRRSAPAWWSACSAGSRARWAPRSPSSPRAATPTRRRPD